MFAHHAACRETLHMGFPKEGGVNSTLVAVRTNFIRIGGYFRPTRSQAMHEKKGVSVIFWVKLRGKNPS